ncbi:hypothetical protein MMC09_001240 [Bachmanniomyces sp. S44760]|nr:hypothetical protein [Bachmanniomyces sp. S44760]
MSGASTPSGRPAKTMSSRLMTMKFMQRAAASSSPSSSTNNNPHHPTIPTEPPSKRQKFSNSKSSANDLQAITAALEAEESKRSEALERQGVLAGETKWVLSYTDGNDGSGRGGIGGSLDGGLVRVVTTGFSEIDRMARGEEKGDKDHDERRRRPPLEVGRRSFGKFNRALEKRQSGEADTSSSEEASGDGERDDDGESDDDDDDSDSTGAQALIRKSREEATQRLKAERKAQRRAEKAEALRLAERRKSKEVKLNKLSSISGGGGGGGGGGGSNIAKMECYNCGEKGHAKKDCPQRVKKRKKDERLEY